MLFLKKNVPLFLNTLFFLSFNANVCQTAPAKVITKEPQYTKINGLIGNFSVKIGLLMKGLINAKMCPGKSKTTQSNLVFNRIYIYGPKGCGKTTLAKTIADETGAKLIEKSAFSIVKVDFDKEVQEVEQLFRDAHEHLMKHKQPVVIFIDEAHNLTQTINGKSRLGAQALWIELDKINNEPGIVVILASNTIDNISKPLLDRFPYTVEIHNLEMLLRQDFFEVLWLRYGKTPPDMKLMTKLANESAGLSIRGIEDTMKTSFADALANGYNEPNESEILEQLKLAKKNELGTFASKIKDNLPTIQNFLKGTLATASQIAVIILAIFALIGKAAVETTTGTTTAQ